MQQGSTGNKPTCYKDSTLKSLCDKSGGSGAVLEDPIQALCLRRRKCLGVKSGSALDCVLLLMRGNALERENVSSEWRMLDVSDHPTRKGQDARS